MLTTAPLGSGRRGTFALTRWNFHAHRVERSKAHRRRDSDKRGSLLITRNPFAAGESRPKPSTYWRRRKRRIDTNHNLLFEPRPYQVALSKRPRRRAFQDKSEKLHLRRFLGRSKIRIGVIFVALALGDCRTHGAGMLPVKSRCKRLGNRGGNRTRNEHPSPRRALQYHPVRSAQIQSAT